MGHLLSAYAMGGTAECLEEVYISHNYQEPVKPSPEVITDSNFVKHLGDIRCASAVTSSVPSGLLQNNLTTRALASMPLT
jgi:hypothetical protein